MPLNRQGYPLFDPLSLLLGLHVHFLIIRNQQILHC
jgi:hypothetical protein